MNRATQEIVNLPLKIVTSETGGEGQSPLAKEIGSPLALIFSGSNSWNSFVSQHCLANQKLIKGAMRSLVWPGFGVVLGVPSGGVSFLLLLVVCCFGLLLVLVGVLFVGLRCSVPCFGASCCTGVIPLVASVAFL
ncbi:hypothetical protein Q3G72_031002 [Acer saccharum]|nr:hypothetical protein Q3G72_031002 [Acer saccharum]